MPTRVWIRSGIEEEIDARQQRLLDLVLEKVRYYYMELHLTRSCYQYPLSLAMLMRLTKRNSYTVISAVRLLSNSCVKGSGDEPPIYYDRAESQRNRSHRPYRIFLRERSSKPRT